VAQAGHKGEGVRGDCWVKVEPGGSGITIKLESKVQSMYGEAILQQARTILEQLGVSDAVVEIVDSGALPFVIAARLETAVHRAGIAIKAPALPEAISDKQAVPQRERLRRSRLYLPGNQPKLFINAGLHNPDSIILDLEDSVAPGEKGAARVVVRNALIAVDFMGAEPMVRINQLPAGLEDLEWVAPYGVHVILIPKCESAEQVREVDERVASLSPTPILLMPIIESALGCFHALEIATASPNVVALTIGLEDYTADIGAQRTREGRESFWARSIVVNAARAAGVQPIDTVFSDVDDMDGLRESALEAKGMGFEGKGCIHPRQIPVIHKAFSPSPDDLDRAIKIMRAFSEAESRGLGVVSLGSKMIDPPVVKRAQHTVDLAIKMGMLKPNWREEAS
jgi:citrate lyase subunit beta / citryl-CoA lyase